MAERGFRVAILQATQTLHGRFFWSAQMKGIGNLMRVTAGLVAATLAGTVVYVGATAVRFEMSDPSEMRSFAFLRRMK